MNVGLLSNSEWSNRPSFIKSKSNRSQAAAFEQSLRWTDLVETGG